jgi:hypothetical protein
MVKTFQSDFKQIVFRVIRDAYEWKPLRRKLVTKRQPSDFYFRALTSKAFRNTIEIRLPVSFR